MPWNCMVKNNNFEAIYILSQLKKISYQEALGFFHCYSKTVILDSAKSLKIF